MMLWFNKCLTTFCCGAIDRTYTKNINTFPAFLEELLERNKKPYTHYLVGGVNAG